MRSRCALLIVVLLAGTGGVFLWQDRRATPVRRRIDAGIDLWQSGQVAAAQSQWQEAVQLDPSNAQAWSLLGELYLETRDFKAAQNAFSRALKTGTGASGEESKAAYCALQLQDFKAARLWSEAALKRNADDVAALGFLAQIEKRENHSDAQLRALQHIVELQPENGDALLNVARELSLRSNFDQLLPVAERLVKVQPEATTSYFLRGLALFNTSSTPASDARDEADFKKAAQLNPTAAEAHRFLGRLYLRQNQPRRAISEFETIGHLRPYASAHLLELSQALRAAGQAQKAGQTEALFSHLKEVNRQMISLKSRIGAFPRDPQPSLQMASLLLRCVQGEDADWQLFRYRFLKGELQSMSAYLSRAAHLSSGVPKMPLAREMESTFGKLLQEATINLNKRDFIRAKNAMARVLALRPDDARALQTMSRFRALNLDPMGTLTPPSPDSGFVE